MIVARTTITAKPGYDIPVLDFVELVVVVVVCPVWLDELVVDVVCVEVVEVEDDLETGVSWEMPFTFSAEYKA